MKIQKSFHNNKATLYLVATPIGNLSELTPRAIEILQTVDYIAAEDTRQTRKLLTHFNISTRLISHHKHNEKDSTSGLLKLLEEGNNIALVSDAGYPLISDPGETIVKEAINADYNVVPISGSSAVLNALVASGLTTSPFVFLGFINQNIKKELERINEYPETIIIFEAPHRIQKTLTTCLEILGNRQVSLAKEITKKFEEFYRGELQELIPLVEDIKGELVLIIEGYQKPEIATVSVTEVNALVEKYIAQGFSTKEAIKLVAQQLGMRKNDVYKGYHLA